MFTSGKLVKYIIYLTKEFFFLVFLIEVYIHSSYDLRAMMVLKYNKTYSFATMPKIKKIGLIYYVIKIGKTFTHHTFKRKYK